MLVLYFNHQQLTESYIMSTSVTYQNLGETVLLGWVVKRVDAPASGGEYFLKHLEHRMLGRVFEYTREGVAFLVEPTHGQSLPRTYIAE
jgi:hypothetical protein